MTPAKPPPGIFQPPTGAELPKSLRETYAEALKAAERELREAQGALSVDDGDDARARYARALMNYDVLQGSFPFVAAGACDAQA